MPKSMIFLVLVLSTVAWSAPNGSKSSASKIQDIEDDVNKGLEKLSEVGKLPKEALENAQQTFSDILGYITEASENIEKIYAEMSEVENAGNEISQDFLLKFNEVKNELRECRQELRQLATSTVLHSKDLKTLVEELDTNSDIVLLQATIDTMKDLLINTKEKLSAANTKYRNAIRVMTDIESRMKILILDLENRVNENSNEYKQFAHEVRSGTYTGCTGLAIGMAIADALGCFGLCSATVTSTCFGVGVPAVEGTLAQYRATITDFIEISTKVKDNIGGMETSVNDAVAVLEHELSILHEWEEISDNLSTKMERYPIKYLQKFKSIRKIFVRNVHDLEEVAQKFLDQPVSFFADDQ